MTGRVLWDMRLWIYVFVNYPRRTKLMKPIIIIDNPLNICRPLAGLLIIIGVCTGKVSLYLASILILMDARVMLRWRD